MQRSSKAMPLKPFLNLVNSLTLVPLTAVSSQNTSQGSHWVKTSSHKTWQGCNRTHAEGKRGKKLLLESCKSQEMYGVLNEGTAP